MFISVDLPAPEGPMIPMSSRWQNFPDRHLRRVLYPGGKEQRGSRVWGQCKGAATASRHRGDPKDLHVCHSRRHFQGALCPQVLAGPRKSRALDDPTEQEKNQEGAC